jgi:6-phosphogluconolactonase
MQFRKVDSIEPVATYLAGVIQQHITAGEKVLWLVPGGSVVAVAVAVAHKLWEKDMHNLTITLGDERFGAVDHADSNWKQLKEAGFKFTNAQMMPVLTGEDRGPATQHYADNLQRMFEACEYRLALFGLGPDGHVAGILPGSPAVEAKEWAVSYPDAYERMTMTPPAILKLDEAVVYAAGAQKHAMLDELEKDLPLSQQPAQILKKLPKATIFNDYKGDLS